MKRILFCILFFGFIFSPLFAQVNFKRKNFTLQVGTSFSASLKTPADSKWELHVVTKRLVSLVEKKIVAGNLRFVLKMNKIGLGKLETTLIRKKNGRSAVVRSVYYYFKIVAKGKTSQKIDKKDPNKKTAKKQQDTPEHRDFMFARSVFRKGYYMEAVSSFAIYRKKYPKSPYYARASIYEGQALFHLKQYAKALPLFKRASTSSGKERYISFLWMGYVNDQLGKNSAAVFSFLNALSGIAYPEIIIRARTGFALYYARRKKQQLADMQFSRIFISRQHEKLLAYQLALYRAASFYDANGFISKAHRAYSRFVKLVAPVLQKGSEPAHILLMLRRYKKGAQQRLGFLEKNFINYH